MAKNINFTCPYCNQPTTITDPNQFYSWERIVIENSTQGEVGFSIYAITCPNPACKKLYLKTSLTDAKNDRTTNWEWLPKNIFRTWQLLPESEAKVLPDYIPLPIQEDYYEACRVRDLSPKASATLARRCLQGMIRDFWKIRKSHLKDEIDELKDKVDPDIWESIDAVRNVGNIGAHMERDINIIIDVEPGEAQLLIGLIEQLVDDWYVTRESRHQRTEDLKKLAAGKEAQKKSNIEEETIENHEKI
jgi:hypothetical protein